MTVIERFPSLRTEGQNVDIRTAGVTVMRRMKGMEAAVRSSVAPIEGISFVGTDGRLYGVMRGYFSRKFAQLGCLAGGAETRQTRRALVPSARSIDSEQRSIRAVIVAPKPDERTCLCVAMPAAA